MKSLQFFKISALILMLLNVALIIFLVVGPRRGANRHRPSGQKRAIEILQLSDAQYEAFLTSAHKHGEALTALEEEQKSLIRNYFAPLLGQEAQASRELDRYSNLEEEKIHLTYTHLEEIFALLDSTKRPPNPPQDFRRKPV
jgi:hypothetical protein